MIWRKVSRCPHHELNLSLTKLLQPVGNRDGTGESSRQLQGKADGVTPAGFFYAAANGVLAGCHVWLDSAPARCSPARDSPVLAAGNSIWSLRDARLLALSIATKARNASAIIAPPLSDDAGLTCLPISGVGVTGT
jgi:hypothetical protein